MSTGSLLAAEGITEEAQTACNEGVVCRWVLDRTDNELISQFLGVLVPDILRTVLIFLAAWFLVRVIRRAIRRIVENIVERDSRVGGVVRRRVPLASTQSLDPARAAMRTETLGTVLRSVASLVIWTAAVFVAVGSLNTLDINLGPLIAGAGIVGVALGFGSQSLVKDFLSGMFMLLEDQYGVGDIVDVGPATGVVEGITLRTTRLRDVEGVLWHVPNGEIARVGNLSQQWSRSLLDIPVSYETNIPQAIDIIKATADSLWTDPAWRGLVLEEPDVWGVEQFTDTAVLIRVVTKVVPAQQWAVSRELRLRIKAEFDRVGIVMPHPQLALVTSTDEQHDVPRDGNGRVHSHRARTGEYDTAPPKTARDADERR